MITDPPLVKPVSALLAKQNEAAAIVARLSLQEKVELCSGRDMWFLKSVSTIVPPIMITDGPHGLRKQLEGDSTDLLKGRVKATCFPTASCLACSWDPDLLHQVGVALANECIQENVAVLLGPGMNIKRHVLGGRNFEYLSEDPYLSGKLATSLVDGIQSQGVGCSIKHFCVNNQETARMRVNAIVDERTLREIYFRGFEYTLGQVQPWTIMCAYNRLNGVFCSEHEELWNMVRDEWGFDGVVMTDWGATSDRVEGIRATVDLEMPGSKGSFDKMIVEAVDDGSLPMETLDAAVGRNVALSLLGLDVMERNVVVDMDKHHALARQVAMECAVLLRNENHLLPLAKNTKVAVIGDFAKNPRYQGMGSSQVNPSQLDCAWDRIQDYTHDAVYAQGYNRGDTGHRQNSVLIQEAVDAASRADVALIFCGLPEICESEGFDRPHMDMPANHNALVEAVCTANPRTVVILSNGAPVSMPWVYRTGAILEGYLSGQAGGSAIVDLIFGVASPSGKLAETFPVCAEDLASNGYFPGDHDQVQYREGLNVGYRHFDSAKMPVLFPFGHGLSYTQFDYRDIQVSVKHDHNVHIQLTIANRGSMEAAEIVQCYVHDKVSTVYRPEQELKAFAKLRLKPGEQTTVDFTLFKDAFAFYDVGHASWILEAGEFEIRIGASSLDIRLHKTVKLSSTDAPVSARAREAHPPFHYHVRGRGVSDEAFRRMLGYDELPTPVVDVWPFHHNTLMYELQHSFMGNFFRRQVLDAATSGCDDPNDPSQRRLMEALVDHTPLRNLVVFSQGALHFEDLAVILHVLNLSFWNAILGIGPCIKRRLWRHRSSHRASDEE